MSAIFYFRAAKQILNKNQHWNKRDKRNVYSFLSRKGCLPLKQKAYWKYTKNKNVFHFPWKTNIQCIFASETKKIINGGESTFKQLTTRGHCSNVFDIKVIETLKGFKKVNFQELKWHNWGERRHHLAGLWSWSKASALIFSQKCWGACWTEHTDEGSL